MKPFLYPSSIVMSLIVVALCLAHPMVGQMEKRVIPFPGWALDQEDEEIALNLVEIKVGGIPVVLGQPFDATEDWLNSMTLRVKNISKKPIVAFGVGGGLLEGVSKELPPNASFENGIAWNWGKRFDPEKGKPEGAVLKPGETIELNYDQVDQLAREVLAKKGEGAFRKLQFMAPAIQYADGSTEPSRMRFSVPSHGGQTPAPRATNAKTLEEKLAALNKCGLGLKQPFTVDELLKSWDRKQYEEDGYDLVLHGLGMTEEQEPSRDHSANVWHFDAEAIEDNGSYKRIADRMVELSQGSLSLQDIKDHVDIEKGQAWLSFTFKGKSIKLDFVVKDDWVDPTVFTKFVELLNQSDPSKFYILYYRGGQDCIISCVTKENFECLKGLGINFVPLT